MSTNIINFKRAIFFIVSSVLFLCYATPHILAYTNQPETTLSVSVNTHRVSVGQEAVFHATLTNASVYSIQGIWYSVQVPETASVSTVGVLLNGEEIAAYSYLIDIGRSGDVSAEKNPHRWVIETPPNFNQQNPILASSGTLEVIYTVSSNVADILSIEHMFAGQFTNETPVFGYADTTTTVISSYGTVNPDVGNCTDTVSINSVLYEKDF